MEGTNRRKRKNKLA